ncbi:SMC-Scp complex subunit ScpB [Polymorphospora sp. A560]
MNGDERRESLAEQAAAWVPPWERTAAPRKPDEQADPAAADPGPDDRALADPGPDDRALADSGPDDRAPVGTVSVDVSGAEPDGAAPAGEPAEPLPGTRPVTDVDADPTTGTATTPAEPVEPSTEPSGPVEPAGPTEATGPAAPAVRDKPAVPDEPTPPAVRDRPAAEDPPPAGEPEPTDPTGGDAATAEPNGSGPPASGEPAGSGPPAQPAAGPEPAVPVPGRKGNRTAARDRRPEPELPALTDDAELRGALEAILLVVDQPVADVVLAQVLEQPTARVTATLERISADYTAAGHGFELRRAAGGWRLYTRPEYAAYVERFVLDGQSVRLTQAALETLAVVAYKQPVTRSRISAIRGVNCDGVLRTLVTRGLVEECGTESETGAFLYRTTVLFLEKLGLDTVDQLPPLAPFLPDDVEEIADAQR